MNFFTDIWAKFEHNFIQGARWRWVLEGLGNTLTITFFALLMGIVIAIVIAAVRSTYDKNKEDIKRKNIFVYILFWIVNAVCNLYLTVIRGIPVVVQIMITYYIIFATSTNDIMTAIIAFGINSGAYVAEIFRGGIMSIDEGQFEAGRSLGFNYLQTMWYIIIPQVFKTTLPTLCNEFIVLLKETSVAGYIGIMDLTKAAELIRGNTYDAMFPLFTVALIYLVLVIGLTKLVSLLEKKLRKNER